MAAGAGRSAARCCRQPYRDEGPRAASPQTDLSADLASPPLPSVAITAGSTWGFQLWYRDVGGTQSNFSDGVLLTFEP